MGQLPFLCTPVIGKKKKSQRTDNTMCLFLSHKNKAQFLFSYKILLVKGKEVNLTFEVLCEWSHLEEKVGNWMWSAYLCSSPY